MADRILIIDDEESIRFTFSRFLLEAGYQVASAATLDEAKRLISDAEYDLVFLDILLGSDQGMEFLHSLHEAAQRIPVIMMTGFPSIDTAAEALRLGAFDYLPKPINQQQLLRATHTALRFRALDKQRQRHQAHLDAMFRCFRDAVITVDRALCLVSYNRAAEELCEFSTQHLGQPLARISSVCAGHCAKILQHTLEQQEPRRLYRSECCSPSGDTRILSLDATPLTDEDGSLFGALLVVRDETRLDQLERQVRMLGSYHNLIGASAAMQSVYDLLDRLAQVDTAVLISGESGTGKELAADALHQLGPRRHKPLVKVNCSALTESLLESELFGHVKGAFTGAFRDSPGRFEIAHGGTLFLDEVGDISPRIQVKLLRVLQEKIIERVGDSTPIPVDVRIVAATHQDLAEKIKRGEFREDLYYRLKVVDIELPPLRRRMDDLPLLVNHFMDKFNRKFSRQVRGISQDAEQVFLSHHWPGNVRELEHVMEHAFILGRTDILTVEDLPAELRRTQQVGRVLPSAQKSCSAESLQQALVTSGGNKAMAARLLGISRRTLYRKLHELNIDLALPQLRHVT